MRTKTSSISTVADKERRGFGVDRLALRNRLASWWLAKNLRSEFWRFLCVKFLFDSGMFIFFLLYNLYLLDLGFKEDFLGWTTGAMGLGTIAGSLPAGLLVQRFGLRKALLVCLALTSAISAFRSACTSGTWLLCLAFFGGAAAGLWAVCVPPIVAQLTDDKNRPFAFSIVFSSGIGFGVLAGLVGGYLPKWMLFLAPRHTAVGAKQAALLLACGLAGLALWPASRLEFKFATAPETRHYPRNSFVFRFFPALAVWSFATGAFTPFFNAYFSHGLGISVERIGKIFSLGQLVQALAVLAAPFVFRKFGLLTGILYTQILGAFALEWLATGPRGWSVAVAYAGYTSFLWMSEPGMYSLLMNNVKPGERAGASGLNVLVISGTQAIAAAAAGVAFARYGYPVVMTVIGTAILAAAFLFRYLLYNECTQSSAQTTVETVDRGVAA
jgi:predicted MFS family arabinose efflux permease